MDIRYVYLQLCRQGALSGKAQPAKSSGRPLLQHRQVTVNGVIQLQLCAYPILVCVSIIAHAWQKVWTSQVATRSKTAFCNYQVHLKDCSQLFAVTQAVSIGWFVIQYL